MDYLSVGHPDLALIQIISSTQVYHISSMVVPVKLAQKSAFMTVHHQPRPEQLLSAVLDGNADPEISV